MTFDEYIHQENPRSHPHVTIRRNECFHCWPTFKGEYVEIVVHGEHFVYLRESDGNQLWTMDGDGNKKKRSVFHLIEDES